MPTPRFRRLAESCLALTLIAAGSGRALGRQPPPDEAEPFERPAYRFLRHTEDWSGLRDVDRSQLTDPWDAIKYVPLTDDGGIWASFGGSTRLQVESWSDFAFGGPADSDDTFLLWRALLHADVHFGDNIRAFVQGKSALASDRDLPGGKRILDEDRLDLEQAFAEVAVPVGEAATLTIRPGRQTFLFGKQRLVSPLPWANTLRRWDGASGILTLGDWSVHGFWTQFVPVRRQSFNEPDDDIELFGVYATGKVPRSAIDLDLYWLGLDRATAGFNGTSGSERRHTFGGRVWGTLEGLPVDYDVEGAYQLGEVGSDDVDAFMVAGELGYKPDGWWGSPRFRVGFDYASGDSSAGGGVETFNQLFPLGHAYFGYMDFVGRQNIIDVSSGVTLSPLQRLVVGVAGHLFWRADDADALYNAGGGVVRGGGSSSSDEIGSELDITVKYQFDRHLTGLLGYSHFFAGDFIDESGANDDMDFVYVQLEYTF
ncbi:MAG: alginate export family protein [Planctomycetota bacterium]|jgi:hypothetical protein